MRSGLGLSIVALTAVSALSCSSGNAKSPAQMTPACDHLEPLPSPLTDPNYSLSPQYELAIAATLFPRVPMGNTGDEELLMVMVDDTVPEPQEAVYILAPAPSPTPVTQYRVVHVRARSRVAETAVEADFSNAFLDRDAVAALERVWTGMTAAARWRTRDEVLPAKLAIHGSSSQFIFDYWGNHVFSQGMTFAPEDGSCSAILVSIGELLGRFADQPDEQARRAIRGQIMGEIGKLSDRLAIGNDGLCGGSPCRTASDSKGSVANK
jgi:hypothetical protein